MPIRINLLAEQQAAEEARRRDPVKRTLWAACAFVALFLLWAGNVQLKLARGRSTLGDYELQWKQVESKFLQVSNQISEVNSIQKNLDNLQSYATNRFLWTVPLNALQHATDDRVRVVSLIGASALKPDARVLIETNLYIMRPQRRWWSWSAEPLKTNIQDLVRTALNSIMTNPSIARFESQVITNVKIVTNQIQIVAQIEVIKPQTISEQITMKLEARDYSPSPGGRVDPFFAKLKTTPYFEQALDKTNAILRTLDFQPRPDPTDFISKDAQYISFLIDCFLPERIYSNE